MSRKGKRRRRRKIREERRKINGNAQR